MCQGKQTIASSDPMGYPPQAPDCGAAAACVTYILNVIMYQGEIMHQLDPGGQRKGLFNPPADGLARQQHEVRAHEFPRIGRGWHELCVAPSEMILLHGIETRHARLDI